MTLLKILVLCLLALAVSVAFAAAVTLLFRGPAWLFSLGRKHARESRGGGPSPPRRWLTPLVVSLLLTPFLIHAGIASAGAGHGDYGMARILFPYTMLSVRWNGVITPFHVGVAVAQWPLYGLILSLALRRSRQVFFLCLLVLVAVHAGTAMGTFRVR